MELYNFLWRIKSNPNMYQANVYMQSKSWVAPWHRFCYTCFNSLKKVFTVWIEQNFSNLTVFRLQLPTFRVNIHKTYSWQTDCSSNLDFWFQSRNNINPQLTTNKVTENKEQRLANWVSAQSSVQEKSQFQFPGAISKSLFWLLSFPCNFN